jgi:hypothetical protein
MINCNHNLIDWLGTTWTGACFSLLALSRWSFSSTSTTEYSKESGEQKKQLNNLKGLSQEKYGGAQVVSSAANTFPQSLILQTECQKLYHSIGFHAKSLEYLTAVGGLDKSSNPC